MRQLPVKISPKVTLNAPISAPLKEILSRLGFSSSKGFAAEAFSRSLGLLNEAEQSRLWNSTIAIPGLGGVGGSHLISLVRCGIGRFHLSDLDVFEVANFNRQYGAKVTTVGREKLEVMSEEALQINPYLTLKHFPQGVTEENLDSFLEGVDLVVDGFDFFALEIRRKLFKRARELGIYVITAGPIGFGSSMLVFSPDSGFGFDQYFDIHDGLSEQEKYLRFAVGLSPRSDIDRYLDFSKINLVEHRGPSSGIACCLCSAMASATALRVLLGKPGVKAVPHYSRFDPFVSKYYSGKLWGGNSNPMQRIKMAAFRSRLGRVSVCPQPDSIPQPVEVSGSLTEDSIRFLVRAGIRAPSGDNSQHWRFRWDGEVLQVINEPERSDFFYSVRGEPIYLSLGAVVENIRVAAIELGLASEIEFETPMQPGITVVKLRFSLQSADEESLYSSIYLRGSDRRPFEKREVSAKIVDILAKDVAEFQGAKLHWIAEESEKKRLSSAVGQADKVLWQHQKLHRDLFNWIRLGKSAVNAVDGMAIETLGLRWFQKPSFPLLANWKLVSFLNHFGFPRLMAEHSNWLIKHSGACCILTLAGENPEDYFRAGMMIERFWLRATSLGLSLQPLSGAVLLPNHLAYGDHSEFNPEALESLREIGDKLTVLTGRGDPHIKAMIFRIGYNPKPKVDTPRRPIEQLLEIEIPQGNVVPESYFQSRTTILDEQPQTEKRPESN